jgi:hypothetical protein
MEIHQKALAVCVVEQWTPNELLDDLWEVEGDEGEGEEESEEDLTKSTSAPQHAAEKAEQ